MQYLFAGVFNIRVQGIQELNVLHSGSAQCAPELPASFPFRSTTRARLHAVENVVASLLLFACCVLHAVLSLLVLEA